MAFYIHGNIYQAFNATPENQIKTLVNFVDKDSGEIIKSLDSSKDTTEEDVEKQKDLSSSSERTEVQIDMSGDYIGDIPCPEPPVDSTYTIYNINDYNDCIVLHVDNIDNGNFRFYLAQATLIDPSTSYYTEEPLFLEHIAHYNGNGFYEYIGKDYHIYFRYVNLYPIYASENPERPEVPVDHQVEVYGLEKLYSPNQYIEYMQFENISGNAFRMNVPFAG